MGSFARATPHTIESQRLRKQVVVLAISLWSSMDSVGSPTPKPFEAATALACRLLPELWDCSSWRWLLLLAAYCPRPPDTGSCCRAR
eukprot:4444551-Alexandrium_andersonii.AAC.1